MDPKYQMKLKLKTDYIRLDWKKMQAGGLWPVGILDIEKQLQWDKMTNTWNVEDIEQQQERGAPSDDAIEE